MSYDIWLDLGIQGLDSYSLGDWNYTSNCRPMWEAAGIDLDACAGRDAGGCAEGLGAAIQNLKADPDRFRLMDPPNGWGSYDTLVPALERLLALFEVAPRATVRVWR